MQSNERPRARRVHDAQIKSKVLAECRQVGASVPAIALAHGLNASLVHQWLRGRGLQRVGLGAEATAGVAQGATARAALQFVPVGVSARGEPLQRPRWPAVQPPGACAAAIEVELRCAARQMTVRWPPTQAAPCTRWLAELAAAVLQWQATP